MKMPRGIVILLLLTALPAAAVQRTFVSSTGSDANTCLRDQPCRNFAAAIAQTSPGGEVVVLDSAGYGPIPSIPRSISIIAPLGVHAAITATSTPAIHIDSAGASIVLRNLYLTGLGGTYGIVVIDASSLTLENISITGFEFNGLHVQTGSTTETTVADSVFRNNGSEGVFVSADSGFLGLMTLVRCRFEGNGYAGILASTGGRVMIRESAATGNDNAFAVTSFSATDVSRMELDSCTAFHNTIWLYATSLSQSASGLIRVSNSSITANTTGIVANPPFQVVSQGNNTLEDNGTNGLFTLTVVPK